MGRCLGQTSPANDDLRSRWTRMWLVVAPGNIQGDHTILFAAWHADYARYWLYYLRSLEKLSVHILPYFLKGEHVMYHIQCIWNGIWGDLFNESTPMRHGHSKGGIVGITIKAEVKAATSWSSSSTNIKERQDESPMRKRETVFAKS